MCVWFVAKINCTSNVPIVCCSYVDDCMFYSEITGTVIEPSHFAFLIEQLLPCSSKWEMIAVGLRFTHSEIESIKLDPKNVMGGPTACLTDVIHQWMQWCKGDARGSKDKPTLEALKTAVHKAGFLAIAVELNLR